MINIITALGNKRIYEEIIKSKEIKMKFPDIQYKEGIIECLKKDNKIEYIFIHEKVCEKEELIKLIEEINKINSKIKIIIFLYEKSNKNRIIKKKVYKIYFNIQEPEEIINIILFKKYIIKKEEKSYKNNENNKVKETIKKIKELLIEKNKKKKKVNKEKSNIISFSGIAGVGKSSYLISKLNKVNKSNQKILIIDFDLLNSSLHTLLGKEKYNKKIYKNKNDINNYIMSIKKNTDLLSGLDQYFLKEENINSFTINQLLNKMKKTYNIILIDLSSQESKTYNYDIIKNSDNCIFLIEPYLIQIEKAKRILNYYQKQRINENKIKIKIIDKSKKNLNKIDKYLLKEIFCNYKILKDK